MGYLTYTFKMYPNKVQKCKIDNNFKACRLVYNKLCDMRIKILRKFQNEELESKGSGENFNRKKFNFDNRECTLPELKEKFNILKEADSLALCAEWNNLNNAFIRYYRHLCKLPKFKGKKDKNSYTTSVVNNNIRIEGRKIRLPKIGFVKIKMSRQLPMDSIIKRVIVKEDKCGNYYVCVVFKYDISLKDGLETSFTPNNSNDVIIKRAIGLDYKLGEMFISSNYEEFKHNFCDDTIYDKIKKLVNNIKIKIRFSKGWYRILTKIRVLYIKIKNIRKCEINSIVNRLTKNYDIISIEDICVREIAARLHTGKNVYRTPFYMLKTKLIGKIIEFGKTLKIVDKYEPTSKRCNKCYNIKYDLTLEDRVYFCEFCGNTQDRDKNAALNILRWGIEH